MFGFFGGRKRAETVATSIGQLIHMLSQGYESLGPQSPERALRRLASSVTEQRTGAGRTLNALVPITPDQAMWVSLLIDSTGDQGIHIGGNDTYFGFSLTCKLPLHAVIIDLQPATTRPVTKQARLLYAACRSMPNVVEGSRFR
jgi:hypothetical protein